MAETVNLDISSDTYSVSDATFWSTVTKMVARDDGTQKFTVEVKHSGLFEPQPSLTITGDGTTLYHHEWGSTAETSLHDDETHEFTTDLPTGQDVEICCSMDPFGGVD